MSLLEAGRGQSISGEQIAQSLKISRNAVWKAVNELKKDGYKIEAVPNKGYLLCEDNDILSVQGILPFLSDPQTAHISVYPSLESTNTTAKELALAGAEHGTVVIADCQTAGRGRYNRSFYSPPGSGIYMSFVLRPEPDRFETPTLITAFAAVAVCEAITELTSKTPRIKWVNDIYCDGKKICGILTEAVTDFESGRIGWVVVGIGLNFRSPKNAFPADLRQIAGSLFANEESTITRNRLAAGIVNKVLDFAGYRKERMLENYRRLLFMLGSEIQVITAKDTYEATAVDLDDLGRLLVKTKDGEIQTLSSGEISIRSHS